MFRKLILLTFLFFTGLTLKAQTPADTTHSLFWEISGNGLQAPSWIFGTMHIICASDYFMPEPVSAAITASKQMVFEIDLDDPETMTYSLGGRSMKNNTRLTDLLTPVQYDSLKRFFKDSLAIDLLEYNTTKPMLLAGEMMQNMLGCETQSYDLNFFMKGMVAKTEIKGLETVKEQYGFLDSIPYKKQAAMLLQSMRDFTASKKELNDMIKLYKTQDVTALQKMFEEQGDDLTEFQPLLLADRNKRWIPQLETYMKTAPSFIAVGAGHLGGSDGVLNLLRAKGYKVKPVM